jgi:ATP-dependent protease ClpP protease subunit
MSGDDSVKYGLIDSVLSQRGEAEATEEGGP